MNLKAVKLIKTTGLMLKQPDFKNIQEAQDYIYQKYGELKFVEEY